ncbi:MAG: aminoacyl-tRNA hydrolase [Actinomycetota bacterium]
MLGLGNPGAEYAGSRHNVGADVVALLADRHGSGLQPAKKEQALAAELRVPGSDELVVVAFPQTYMNDSGRSAASLVTRYGVDDPARIIAIHDELDLDLGVLKLKSGGGFAGHNGLKSLRQHLGTAEFARARIGVGKPPNPRAGANWVLKPAKGTDRIELDVVVNETADAVLDIVSHGIQEAMNRWNGRSR